MDVQKRIQDHGAAHINIIYLNVPGKLHQVAASARLTVVQVHRFYYDTVSHQHLQSSASDIKRPSVFAL